MLPMYLSGSSIKPVTSAERMPPPSYPVILGNFSQTLEEIFTGHEPGEDHPIYFYSF